MGKLTLLVIVATVTAIVIAAASLGAPGFIISTPSKTSAEVSAPKLPLSPMENKINKTANAKITVHVMRKLLDELKRSLPKNRTGDAAILLWDFTVCTDKFCTVVLPRLAEDVKSRITRLLHELEAKTGREIITYELHCPDIETCSVWAASLVYMALSSCPEIRKFVEEHDIKLAVLVLLDFPPKVIGVLGKDRASTRLGLFVYYPVTEPEYVRDLAEKLHRVDSAEEAARLLEEYFRKVKIYYLSKAENKTEVVEQLLKLIEKRLAECPLTKHYDFIIEEMPKLKTRARVSAQFQAEYTWFKRSPDPSYVPGGITITIYLQQSSLTPWYVRAGYCTVALPVHVRTQHIPRWYWTCPEGWWRGFLTAGHCGDWGEANEAGFIAGYSDREGVWQWDLDALGHVNPVFEIKILGITGRRADMAVYLARGWPPPFYTFCLYTQRVANTRCSLIWDWYCPDYYYSGDGLVIDYYNSWDELVSDMLRCLELGWAYLMVQKAMTCCSYQVLYEKEDLLEAIDKKYLTYGPKSMRIEDADGDEITVLYFLLIDKSWWPMTEMPGDSGAPLFLWCSLWPDKQIKFIGVYSGITPDNKYFAYATIWDALRDFTAVDPSFQLQLDTDCSR